MATSVDGNDGRATDVLGKREYGRFPKETKVITVRRSDGNEATAVLKGESIIGVAVNLDSEIALATETSLVLCISNSSMLRSFADRRCATARFWCVSIESLNGDDVEPVTRNA